jgi:signal transduction histidine kinase
MLTIMRRVRAASERHPLATDAALAGFVAAVDVVTVVDAGTGPAGWLWFAVLHLPLVWRRRDPVAVFWAVFVGAVTSWTVVGVDGVYPMVVVLVGVYTVARYRTWRWLWPAAAAAEIVLLAARLSGELAWTDLAALTAFVTAAVLLGLTVRTRRAYLAALEDRTRRLERERDQQAALASAVERARIAREMHDIVTHNLAVIVALADGASLTATAAPQRAADTLATVAATGRQALGEMQRVLGLLRHGGPASADPPGLTPQPGLGDLDELVEQVRGAGLRVVFVREGVPSVPDAGGGLAVYRIVQEALTNTLRHCGPAATAQVRLRHTASGVDLEVTDDGGQRLDGRPGNQPLVRAAAGGQGLAGMTERAAAYGGRVDAGPLPGGGWRVRTQLRFVTGELGEASDRRETGDRGEVGDRSEASA